MLYRTEGAWEKVEWWSKWGKRRKDTDSETQGMQELGVRIQVGKHRVSG